MICGRRGLRMETESAGDETGWGAGIMILGALMRLLNRAARWSGVYRSALKEVQQF